MTEGLDFPQEGIDLRLTLESVEKQYIEAALERAGGNKARACLMLNLKRTTLVEKMRKHKMDLGESTRSAQDDIIQEL